MTQEEQFKLWEQKAFGAGYGTGELPILIEVKKFFELLENDRSYYYETLEEKLGKPITWLLINAFYKVNLIEWGTSARHGWLTSCGQFVRDFIKDKTPEELYEIVMSDGNLCCCDGEMEEHLGKCKNPMTNEKYANELIYQFN